jgi:hypothetical protein
MKIVEVQTQAELEAVIKAGDVPDLIKGIFKLVTSGLESPRLILRGGVSLHVVARESSQPHVVARGSSQPHVVAWGSSQPHVEAWGSSQPHVEAWGSSQPHVVAWGSSQPHVVAWGSSQPHVVAWGSSQPHVEAWGSSQPHVEAWGSSQPHVVARESSQPHVVARESSQPHVVAWGFVMLSLTAIFAKIIAKCTATVSIHIHGDKAEVKGGKQTKIPLIKTAKQWCEYYGVEVKGGIVVLFKGVDDDYSTCHARENKISYKPGATPVAPDWDGGKRECGGGLHFCPHPLATLTFNETAKHFIACPIRLKDIVVHYPANYPTKIKAKGCAGPVYEVDRYGKKI